MTDDEIDDDRLTRFLLGDVSDADRTAIEERFLADEAFFHHLLLVEDELRDAYAAGSLAPADRQRFEERFLIFGDERAVLSTRRALLAEMSARASDPQPLARVSATPPWHEALIAAFRSLGTPLRVSIAGVSALVLAVLAWQVADGIRLRSELSRLSRDAAAREEAIAADVSSERARAVGLERDVQEERRTRALLEQELARRPDAPAAGPSPRMVLSLLLTPGRTRAGGETPTLTIPPEAADVRLLLERPDAPAVGRYDAAVLDADGNEIWQGRGIQSTGLLVALTIPSRVLPEGDFEVTLTSVTAGARERVADYYFRVLRP